MTDPIDPQAVALFRYGLIAEFLHRPNNQPGLYQRLREKAVSVLPWHLDAGRRL